jgi:ribA/ribD-fused uncharacterized protein
MKSNDPYEMMSLVRKIKNYNHSVWTKLAEKVPMKANSVKYSQNPDASAALIATGQKRLGEASTNTFYGTGVGLFAKDPGDFSKWKRKNIMGNILTKIRDSLAKK